jgi:CheY-like chemotaxis protein
MENRRVLVVEAEPSNRRRYSAWLEDSGFEVSACPGPSAPDYSCVGARQGRCPLVEPVDAVVLGLDLDSEVEGEGTSAAELLSLYTGTGRPVVAVGSDPRIVRVYPERLTIGLAGPPTRGQLVGAVGRAIDRAAG